MIDVNEAYFDGKVWLIYGRLPNISKEASTAAITARGGVLVKNVSGKLDFLVMPGPTPDPRAIKGAKAQRAAAVGAKVIGEADFLLLLEGEDPFDASAQPELSPLPDTLAALTYPTEDVDLDSTYFDGKTWFAFGELRLENGYLLSKGILKRRLSARGATLTRDIALADFIAHEGETPLWGARLSDEVQSARDRGAPIFGESDFRRLLTEDARPVPPEQRFEPTRNETFGELRALVQADDWSSEAWSGYVELFDGMNDNELDDALEYAGAYIDRKPLAERLVALAESPQGWLGRAMSGDDDPRLRLARAAVVWENGSTAQFEAMFGCENLEHIEHYALDTTRPVPQRHWELLSANTTLKSLMSLRADGQKFGAKAASQLASSEALSALESLDIRNGTFGKGAEALLFAPGSWPKLTSLELQHHGDGMGRISEALVARGLDGLERLSTNGAYVSDGLVALLQHPTLVGLRALAIDYCAQETLDALVSGKAFDGLTSLDVSWPTYKERDRSFLRDARLGGLEALSVDLSGDDELLGWLLEDSEMARSLVSLELRSSGLDWAAHLRGAKMPNLRSLTLGVREVEGIALDEVFPSLERVEFVVDVDRRVVEFGPR